MTRSFWRPYVYNNDLFDYYFSDTVGSSFGTIAAIFMLITLMGKGKKQDWKLVGIIIVGLIGYEFMGYPSKFDFNDVIARLVFGSGSLVAYFILLRKYGKQ